MELEIKKLSDVVVWADNAIMEMRMDFPDVTEEEFEGLPAVKIFESVKEVVNNAIKRHAVYTEALKNDYAHKEKEVKELMKEIEGRKECYTALKELMDTKYISIEKHNNICNTYEKKVAELKKELEGYKDRDENAKELINNNAKEINKLNLFLRTQEDLTIHWKNKYVEAQKEIDEWESDTSERDAVEELEKQVKYLEKELKKTCTCKELDLKGHQSRETALVNTLADKNDLIKNLVQEIDYYKNQERIRTDQLRATESKVDQLSREKEEKEDDHGKSGFTEYIRYIIAEEEGKFKAELNKRFSEEVSKISQKRTEEELAKVKGVGRTSSGRYPWGAKTIRCTKPNSFHCIYGDDCPVEAAEKCKFAKEENNIPCGEDAIE